MDDIARDYLVLALSTGRLQDGIVDAYYGPPELLQVAIANDPDALALAADAAVLRGRLSTEVADEQRREWLDRQLVALETLAQRFAGVELPYLAEVERCFDARPDETPADDYELTRTELDELLPGTGELRARLAARDEVMTVPADRLAAIVAWLVEELRTAATQLFGAPPGESLSVTAVSGQPWSAYNWYDGGLRSRIEINTDLPTRAPQLIGLLAHEAFPGHHLEHAWKEARLFGELGRAEASVQLINTPEAYISEGLAEVGASFVADEQRWQELLVAICDRAGIALGVGDAEREWRISRALHRLRGASGDAALQLHRDGRSRVEVVEFLEQRALRSREQAEKSLDFIDHPLWRTYVFCYAGGERLLSAWCAAAGGENAQRSRFFRLLTEQLTPSGITAELRG